MALARRDWLSSLEAVRAHRQRFPQGQLAEERDALEVQALAAGGHSAAARPSEDVLGDGRRDPGRNHGLSARMADHQLGERSSAHERHDQKNLVFGAEHVEQWHHVRVANVRKEAGFVVEGDGTRLVVEVVGSDGFDRHVAVFADLAREVNLRHPSLAKERYELIAPDDARLTPFPFAVHVANVARDRAVLRARGVE